MITLVTPRWYLVVDFSWVASSSVDHFRSWSVGCNISPEFQYVNTYQHIPYNGQDNASSAEKERERGRDWDRGEDDLVIWKMTFDDSFNCWWHETKKDFTLATHPFCSFCETLSITEVRSACVDGCVTSVSKGDLMTALLGEGGLWRLKTPIETLDLEADGRPMLLPAGILLGTRVSVRFMMVNIQLLRLTVFGPFTSGISGFQEF